MRICVGWDGVDLAQDVLDVVEPPVIGLEEGTASWAERGSVSGGYNCRWVGGKHEFDVGHDIWDVAIANL